MALAQQALTTQVAAGGRLALGIGLSHKPAVEGRWGLSFDRPALHMREYQTVLRDFVRKGRTRFDGEMFRVSGSVRIPGATPFPILIAALGPRMLRIAGVLSEGTITWMVGLKTLRDHVAPRISAAAEDAGRPKPRICVGVPIAVTDSPAAARQRAEGYFSHYEDLPSYRRMLDIEGAGGPSDVAIIGDEEEVEARLREIADAGATDLLSVVFPADADDEASVARTRALLRSLVGRV
jgi:F420-dependent oxidoreductase-like protein